MWNNPIHVLAITEIRNNGGDDSLWLLHDDQKKIGSCLCSFQLPGIGAKCRKWRWQQKKMSGIWQWLKGAIWKHEAAMHSFIHSVRPVFVCWCSWGDWNLGHMESFLGMVLKGGFCFGPAVTQWTRRGQHTWRLTNLKWVSVNEATAKDGELCQSRRPCSCLSAASSSSSAPLLIPRSKFLGNELFW